MSQSDESELSQQFLLDAANAADAADVALSAFDSSHLGNAMHSGKALSDSARRQQNLAPRTMQCQVIFVGDLKQLCIV